MNVKSKKSPSFQILPTVFNLLFSIRTAVGVVTILRLHDQMNRAEVRGQVSFPSKTPRPAQRPIQPSTHWTGENICPDVKHSARQTTHLHRRPSLRMCGTAPSRPPSLIYHHGVHRDNFMTALANTVSPN
jgi:hypothetical protein